MGLGVAKYEKGNIQSGLWFHNRKIYSQKFGSELKRQP